MFKLAVLAWNFSWNLRFKCHRDNRSARWLAALDKWTALNSNSWDATRNQSSRRQAANMESCTRPELTAALSQYTRRRKPCHWDPQNRAARRMARTSRWWMEGNLSLTSRGNSIWKNWWQVNPLQLDKHASVAKTASGEEHYKHE